jgi:multifunctional methyltransferase subunit TRM112
VKEMLRKIDYEALKSAANDLSIHNLHEHAAPPTNLEECDEIFLRMIHHLLFEIHVIEGNLICPQSGASLHSYS